MTVGLVGVAAVAVIAVIAVFLMSRQGSRAPNPTRQRRAKEQQIAPLQRELIALCHDERVADSLVEAEMLAHAQLDEAQCYRRAIKKLKYDRAR